MSYITSITVIRHVIATRKAISSRHRQEGFLAVWVEADVVTASGCVQTLASGVRGPYHAASAELMAAQEDAEIALFDELRGFGVDDFELQAAPMVEVER